MKLTIDAYDAWDYYMDHEKELCSQKHIIASGENLADEVGEVCITDGKNDYYSIEVTFEVDDEVLERGYAKSNSEAITVINEMFTSLELWESGEYPEEEDDDDDEEDRAFEVYDATVDYIEALLEISPGSLDKYMEEKEVLEIMEAFTSALQQLGYADEDLSKTVERCKEGLGDGSEV